MSSRLSVSSSDRQSLKLEAWNTLTEAFDSFSILIGSSVSETG